jgi:outer membrane receptor protein involved in Fe transport
VKSISLCLGILLWAGGLFAQNLTLLNRIEQTPVAGAVATWTIAGLTSVSDQSGRVTAPASLRAPQPVRIEAEGFVALEIDWVPDSVYTLSLLPDPDYYAEPVVITANRYRQQASQSLSAVSVLDQDELERLNPRSAADALLGVAGVWMQRTNHGGGSPFIRGLSGNQVLLLVDGIRVNNTTFRYGPNQYFNVLDPLTISQVEVVRGQASVAYGTDALGGVVNVLTLQPQFSGKGKRKVSAGWFGKAMSQDMELSTRVTAGYSGSRLAIQVGASWKDFGDVRAGKGLGFQRPSGYDEQSVDIKVRIALARGHELQVSWMRINQDNVGRYDQVAQRGFALWEFDPQRWQQAYIRYKGENKTGKLSWQATVAGLESIEQRRSQRVGNPNLVLEGDSIYTLGFLAEATWRPGPAWEMAFGAEMYGDEVTSGRLQRNETTGAETSQRGLYPTGATAWNNGLYHTAGYTRGRLRLEAGWRYNIFSLRIPDAAFGPVAIQPSALVGHVGGAYSPGGGHTLLAAARTGFRAPNVNDMSTFGPFDSGYEVPAYDLRPERSQSADVGYRFKGKRGMFALSGYYTRLTDLMVREASTFNGLPTYQGEPVFAKRNTGKAYIAGAEAEASVRFGGGYELKGFAVYTYGQDISGDQPLRRIPPLNARLALHRRFGSMAWAEAEVLAAGAQRRLSSGDKSDHRMNPDGTPAWAMANVRMGLRLHWAEATLGFQNLTNTAYRHHGSGIDMVGRSMWVALRVRLN